MFKFLNHVRDNYTYIWHQLKKWLFFINVVYFLHMRNKLSQIQIQKQVLAPLLQQSIAVLLLPIHELNLTIEQELQNNPLLELDEDREEFLQHQRDIEMRQNLDRLAKIQEESNYTKIDSGNEDEIPEERQLSRELTLEDHLMRQLRLEVSDELQLKIGELIIGNIDEDGYLKISCEEIALLLGMEDISRVDHVLSIIQRFEPLGIAARNLKECILIQLTSRNNNGHITSQIVNDHLEDLGKKKYFYIARKLKISAEEVQRIAELISDTDPRPARNYRPIPNNIYIKPDVFITKDPEDEYQITVNMDGIPPLRINCVYKNMLNRPNLKLEEKKFIQERLQNALYFIKSIEQRGQTIRRITEHILKRQKDFFDGNYLAIAPMTLKDVATAINRNESTISRAIHEKYIDTPQGLFPMKFFFSQAVSTATSDSTSSQGIKEEIKELIEDENLSSPLSDRDIQRHFQTKGIHLARRTITKYRETLKIPPSYSRKVSKLN